jgi:hypothetical protein
MRLDPPTPTKSSHLTFRPNGATVNNHGLQPLDLSTMRLDPPTPTKSSHLTFRPNGATVNNHGLQPLDPCATRSLRHPISPPPDLSAT